MVFTKLTPTVQRSVKKLYTEFDGNPTNRLAAVGKQKYAATTQEVLHLLQKHSLMTKVTVIKTTLTKTRIGVIRITIGTLRTIVTTLMNLLAYVVYLLSN
jgi:hypothetical protein